MSELCKIIGTNIRQLRESANLTQEMLATIAGIDRGYISDIESGKRNISIDILEKCAKALNLPIEFLFSSKKETSSIRKDCFRTVPMPDGLKTEEISIALQQTQDFFYILKTSSSIDLPSIIQGNNFSGIVSNVFTKKLSDNSEYKEFSEQRYPDLLGPNNIGLEVKASKNPWKGAEGHNGHSGWHIVVCYRILEGGKIEFTQVEIANLIGYGCSNTDWRYLGSKRNSNNSQRTETYTTNQIGTSKLRDGTLYLRSDLIPYKNLIAHRKRVPLEIPKYSPFYSED